MLNHALQPTIKRAIEMATYSGAYKAIVYIPGEEFWVVQYPGDNKLLRDNQIVYTVAPDGQLSCPAEFILENA